MMKTLFFQSAANFGRMRSVQPRPFNLQPARRGALSAVWIETGNPRQPLACVWTDSGMRSVGGSNEGRGTTLPLACTEEDGFPLQWAICA